ncbi:MAG: hypothetical protein C0506_12705 [Anaerolinea sp.]|nr:hypothetical protein [Anaerolinea sp.]
MPRWTAGATPSGRRSPGTGAVRSGLRIWSSALVLGAILAVAAWAGEHREERPPGEYGSAALGLPAEEAQPGLPAPTVSPAPAVTPQPRWPVTIAAVGDIMLARSVSAAITPEQPDGPFAHVREILRSADLTVGNLECAISDGGFAEPKSYTFRAPPLAASGLAVAGFDLVSLANNHSLDFGRDALLDTIETLRLASVAVVGAGRDAGEAYGYRVLVTKGVRVAFLAMGEVPNEGGYNMRTWTAAPAEPGIAWADEERLAATVREAAEAADIVVVMFHFGVEGSTEPSGRQRQLARSAIDAGANLVVGSHPHLLQEVEAYGRGLIAYSLGNFVFDGFEGEANESGILLVGFAADGSLSWRMEPVTIGLDGLPRPGP